jgi:hypothetical protein
MMHKTDREEFKEARALQKERSEAAEKLIMEKENGEKAK